MKKRIARDFSLLGIGAAILCGLLVFLFFEASATRQMEAYVNNSANAMADIFNSGALDKSELDIRDNDELRITWISQSGDILYDTAGATENHADRPEFIEAVQYGSAQARRPSDTLSTEMFYCAKLLDDGSVLRVSAKGDSVLAHVAYLLPFVAVAILFVIILSVIAANAFTKSLVGPIEKIDVRKPLENDTYEEITPLLRRMHTQNNKLSQRIAEVDKMREDLAAIINTMTEGLIVFNKTGLIISVNKSILQIMAVEKENALGQPLLALRRDKDFVAIANSIEKHENMQTELHINGRIYRAMLSQAPEGGSILMFVDETDRCEAEKIRKEFSANVSHELKTPLQSILGYAELLKNGLVKNDDKADFYESIYRECRRLITLVQDIIDLSRLDENELLEQKANIDVLEVAKQIESELKEKAARKNVSLSVQGTAQTISGVHALLYEMIFNTADNAIAYNVDGGSVTISVDEGDDGVEVTVKDTGIGIPQEHLPRVFERFYRVDKSHSRLTGGTGLGLSIVKHAAAVQNATVSLNSRDGEGTTVKMVFPKVAINQQ